MVGLSGVSICLGGETKPDSKGQPGTEREGFSPGEDVHWAEGVRAVEAGDRTNQGLPGSPGSNFYHFDA